MVYVHVCIMRLKRYVVRGRKPARDDNGHFDMNAAIHMQHLHIYEQKTRKNPSIYDTERKKRPEIETYSGTESRTGGKKCLGRVHARTQQT